MKNYHYNTTLGPEWKNKKTNSAYDQSNLTYLTRGKGDFIQGPSIMDVLLSAAKKECTRALTQIDTVFSPLNTCADPDLVQPWYEAAQVAERGSSEEVKRKKLDLSRIAVHVQNMYAEHRHKMAGKEAPTTGPSNLNGSSKRTSFTKLAIEVRQDILRAISKKFSSAPCIDDLGSILDEATIARLRASYAYKYDAEMRSTSGYHGWSRFPWDVAMRELCAIKARALGPHKTVTTGFYERFKLSGRR
jgi:RNA-dependent RNA polymerase